MTFDAFRELLDTLYVSGYELISLNDYLNGHIDVPAGSIPMIFTFDDGTAGQFSFIKEEWGVEGKSKICSGDHGGVQQGLSGFRIRGDILC